MGWTTTKAKGNNPVPGRGSRALDDLRSFRDSLYRCLGRRADTLLNLCQIREALSLGV
jgi:hypothetical protein